MPPFHSIAAVACSPYIQIIYDNVGGAPGLCGIDRELNDVYTLGALPITEAYYPVHTDIGLIVPQVREPLIR